MLITESSKTDKQLTSDGFKNFPRAKILRLLAVASLAIQPSHKPWIALIIRVSSPENKSSGQYSFATWCPARDLRFECIQNRQVRSFVTFVASDRCSGDGKNPHFGFESFGVEIQRFETTNCNKASLL